MSLIKNIVNSVSFPRLGVKNYNWYDSWKIALLGHTDKTKVIIPLML